MPAAHSPLSRRTHPLFAKGLLAALAAALALGAAPAGGPVSAAEPVRAAAADGRIAGAEREALFASLQSRQAAVRAFRATLIRKLSSPLLVAEAVSEGTFLFEKPDRFRWEGRGPDRRVIASDGKTLTIYDPERKEAERRDARDEFSTRMALEMMASGQSLSEMEKRFLVALARRDGMLVLTLTPRSGFLARAVKTITVVHPEDGAVPARIVVLGAKGSRVETVLRDVEINPALPPDAFLVKLGPRVRVFDPAERKARGEDAP